MVGKLVIIIFLLIVYFYNDLISLLKKLILEYRLKNNYKAQIWLHNNFFKLFDVYNLSIDDFKSDRKINIDRHQINQYKIIKLDNIPLVKEILSNKNIKQNLDFFINNIIKHVNINGRNITLDDCVVVDLLQGKGSFPSLHTDIEWGVFDKSDGLQVWYLYKNKKKHGNMFILDTPQVISSSYLTFTKNNISANEQCSDNFLTNLDKSIYTDKMSYLNMNEGECMIFGKSLYHMSDFRKQPNRECLNFRIVIKDSDGGIPVNLKKICLYNSLFKLRINKYLKNNKIYVDRYELLNMSDIQLI